jgi:hypothetical protein
VLAQEESSSSSSVIVGELIFESKCKMVSQRVINQENSNELPKIEISSLGNGYLNDVGNVTETWTFVDIH